jgi:hypothetical protein
MKERKDRFATTAFFFRPNQLMGSSGSPSLNLSMVGLYASSGRFFITSRVDEENTENAYGAYSMASRLFNWKKVVRGDVVRAPVLFLLETQIKIHSRVW